MLVRLTRPAAILMQREEEESKRLAASMKKVWAAILYYATPYYQTIPDPTIRQTPRAPLEAPKHPIDPVSPMRRPTTAQQLSDGEVSPDINRRPTYAVSGSTVRQASAPTSTTPSRRQTEVLSPKSVSPGSRPPWDSSKGDKPRRQSACLVLFHLLIRCSSSYFISAAAVQSAMKKTP